MPALNNDPCNATLISRNDLGDRHTIFRVRPDIPPTFTAGQWTEMGLPKADEAKWGPSGEEYVKDGVVRRAYSIASAPDQKELEFFFNRVDDGQLTRWLWELKEGDRLYVDPEARGHFTLDSVPAGANLVFAGTGTGIAPFACLVRAYTGKKRWKRLVVIQGARFREHLGFSDVFRSTQEHDSSISYIPTLSKPEEDWNGDRGYVQDVIGNSRAFEKRTGVPLDPGRTHVFLCGNSTMIRDVEDRLMPLGFEPRWSDPDGRIHTEIYY
ncbi:MAG: ferredoxin--NADP reductase [bacterium]